MAAEQIRILEIDGSSLTIEEAYHASTQHWHVSIHNAALHRVRQSRHLIEQWLHGDDPVYGVNTGFGAFATTRISHEQTQQLQQNLILSHSAGVGEPIPPEITRAMLLLRINALAKGYSGIREETLQFLVTIFNSGYVPVVPAKGSVGSSGDLAPLSHLISALMGYGEMWTPEHSRIAAKEALTLLNLSPLTLDAKEGLALINGTQMMSAYGIFAITHAKRLSTLADIIAALSIDAVRGSDTPFHPRIHQLRPHPGQRASAQNIYQLLQGSQIRESHRRNDPRVQDPYSFRCAPQVHGAVRDTIDFAAAILTQEINAVTDNPIIDPETGMHYEGGNFHGEPVAFALDYLGIALSELGSISERRIAQMMSGYGDLPLFLTADGGLHSGFMIAQYTAAAIVGENRILAHPASIDSIPTSANQEDHNSFGSIAAQKLWSILQNVQQILAIELLCAAQALEFHRPLRSSPALEAVHKRIRDSIPPLTKDRYLATDLHNAMQLLATDELIHLCQQYIPQMQ